MISTYCLNVLIKRHPIVSRIANNLTWSIVNEIISKVLIFVGNMYLARHLGTESFGIFSLAQALVYYIWVGADLGTYSYGIREISRYSNKPAVVYNPLLTIKIVFGLACFFIYSLSILLYFNSDPIKQFLFIASGVYLVSYQLYIDWIFKGISKFQFIVPASAAASIAFLLGIVIFVKKPQDVVDAAVIWSFSFLVGSAILFCILKYRLKCTYYPCFELKEWKHHLKHSVFFAIAGLLSMLYGYLPIFLTGLWFNHHELGLYSASYKLISIFSAPGFYIALALFPIISESYHKKSEDAGKTRQFMVYTNVTIGLLIFLVADIFAEQIITLFLGNDYIEAIPIFRIFIWILPLQFIRYTLSTTLASTEFQKLQPIPILIGTVSLFVFVLFLPRTLGMITLAGVLGEFVLVLMYFLMSRLTYARSRR